MKQRTEAERVAELEAKIAAIKARGERKRAKANPAVRQAVLAVKAIDKAFAATADATARKALEDARNPPSAWLALEGLTLATVAASVEKGTVKRGRPRKRTMPPSIASEDELARLLDDADACVRDARQLPADAWFEHPVFRALRRDRAIAFLAIHDRHHLRIVREIVGASEPTA